VKADASRGQHVKWTGRQSQSILGWRVMIKADKGRYTLNKGILQTFPSAGCKLKIPKTSGFGTWPRFIVFKADYACIFHK
jgi:hypothetical protein